MRILKLAKYRDLLTRSRTNQSVDTLQQIIADIFNKTQVEKDEGPEAEALLRILIVVESSN